MGKILKRSIEDRREGSVDEIRAWLYATIEAELQNTLCHEISSTALGEMVMQKLRMRDEVAYVRFASVYREFKDIDTFLEELNGLKQALPET